MAKHKSESAAKQQDKVRGGGKVSPRALKHFMNVYAPNRGCAVKVKSFAKDWTHATVQMKVTRRTGNYAHTAFGGALQVMTDPYYVLLTTNQLGRDYVVWDTRAEIEFVKPGLGTLTAEFSVPAEKAQELRDRAQGGAKVLEWFETDIIDEAGDIVARVRREIYVREKRR